MMKKNVTYSYSGCLLWGFFLVESVREAKHRGRLPCVFIVILSLPSWICIFVTAKILDCGVRWHLGHAVLWRRHSDLYNLPCPISCESRGFYILLIGVLLFYFQTALDSLGQRERVVFGD